MSVRVIQGDCRTMLATLPEASVQCVVTSPPYFGLRDYGVDGQIGLEQTPDAYVAEMVGVFREVRRVLADTGVVFLNLGDSYAAGGSGGASAKSTLKNDGRPVFGARAQELRLNETATTRKAPPGYKPKDLLGIPWAVAFALRADGWWLRSDIIWAKPSCMPESVTDRPTSAHEHVFLLTKRAKYFYDADAVKEPTASLDPDHTSYRPNSVAIAGDGRKEFSAKNSASMRSYDPAGRNLRNVWTIATQPYSGAHFATMPPDLAERCIKAGTSERGQCPYCGSPWARVTSRGAEAPKVAASELDRYGTGDAGVHRKVGGQYQKWLDANPLVTTGWSPTCTCPEHKPVPQTVLDPFGGAGTTGLVADRLGRNAVLIELNPQYASLARARVVGDAPLFAEVAD